MRILIAWAVLLIPLVTIADTVVPVDSVESYVNIRQAPQSDADVVGRLQQGSSLPFVASAEGWNEVRLDSGESGFISADWSTVIAEESPAPVAEAAADTEAEPGSSVGDETATGAEPVIETAAGPEALLADSDELLEEPATEAESEPAAEPEPLVAEEPESEPEGAAVADAVAGPTGPAGPPGPPGPMGPPGADGDGAMKGKPDYLVKFKSETTGNASQIFDNGNQVGIGTDEPAQRLDVNGSVQIHDRNSNLAGLMITQADGETGYIMHNRASTLTIGAGSVDRITIDRDGNVGIGVERPEHPIQMASGAHVTAGGVWTNSSSREKKENIHLLSAEEAMATLRALEPVQFNYKADSAEQYVGFIAEDVPEIVATGDRKGLSTMDIVAVLTRVIQAQQQQIEALETRLDAAE